MRSAWSIGATNILPSPISPVLAAVLIASTTLFAFSSVTATSMRIFGKKFTANQILAGASTSAGTDLDDFTYRILRSGQQANYYDLSDPDLDKLLDAQQAEFDNAKRRNPLLKPWDQLSEEAKGWDRVMVQETAAACRGA